RIEPEELLFVVGDFDHRGGKGVFGLDSAEQRARAAVLDRHGIPAAVVAVAAAPAAAELRIGEDPGEAVVAIDGCAVAGRDVDAIDIEVAFVALIVGEQQFARKARRDLLDVGSHAGPGRQGTDITGLDIDAMSLPVLIAALLPKEHEVPVVRAANTTGSTR